MTLVGSGRPSTHPHGSWDLPLRTEPELCQLLNGWAADPELPMGGGTHPERGLLVRAPRGVGAVAASPQTVILPSPLLPSNSTQQMTAL